MKHRSDRSRVGAWLLLTAWVGIGVMAGYLLRAGFDALFLAPAHP